MRNVDVIQSGLCILVQAFFQAAHKSGVDPPRRLSIANHADEESNLQARKHVVLANSVGWSSLRFDCQSLNLRWFLLEQDKTVHRPVSGHSQL